MKMIPHSHFGMPGTIKDHTLVYTVVIAGFLTVFFDLSRIASLGAFFYLVMDMIIHLGVFRHLREEIGARGRSEEHTSELQSLMRISYAVFCLKKKTHYRKTLSHSRHNSYRKHSRLEFSTNIQKDNSI